jgi:hypothetical protein
MLHKPAATADIDFPALISTVLERGLDPAVIQSVLKMYNEHQDRRHMEALNAAVAEVCAEVLPVMRDAQNTHLKNRYATHIAMMTMLQPLLLKHGVRVGFDVGALPGEQPVAEGSVRIRIVVGYGAYCERSSYIDEPVSRVGSQGKLTQMTENQALSSATTYAQRTLLRLKFNISTREEDDDDEASRQNNGSRQDPKAIAWKDDVVALIGQAQTEKALDQLRLKIARNYGACRTAWPNMAAEIDAADLAARERIRAVKSPDDWDTTAGDDPIAELIAEVEAMDADALDGLKSNAAWRAKTRDLFPPDEDRLGDAIAARKLALKASQ